MAFSVTLTEQQAEFAKAALVFLGEIDPSAARQFRLEGRALIVPDQSDVRHRLVKNGIWLCENAVRRANSAEGGSTGRNAAMQRSLRNLEMKVDAPELWGGRRL